MKLGDIYETAYIILQFPELNPVGPYCTIHKHTPQESARVVCSAVNDGVHEGLEGVRVGGEGEELVGLLDVVGVVHRLEGHEVLEGDVVVVRVAGRGGGEDVRGRVVEAASRDLKSRRN